MARKKTPIASINRPKKPTASGAPASYLPIPFTGDTATQAQVPFGFIRFWPPGHPGHAVMVPMGDQGWIIDRTSGWEGVTRPFGLAISANRGMPAVEATVDVVFERWDTQESVQPAWDLFIGLMNHGQHPVTNLLEDPPALMVTLGAANSKITGPHSDATRWVITGIDIDDAESVKDDNNHWIRVQALVTLMQHNTARALRDTAAQIRKANPKPKSERYQAKRGDTLISIARTRLHDPGKWVELRKLNPKIRDPRKKIPAGTSIRLS